VRSFTSFFVLDCILPGKKKKEKKTHKTCVRTNESTNVEKLQVILRPGPSTIGKSNQHRLFLRIHKSFSPTFVWTVHP
jgi:hypothetical protein